MNYDEIHLYSMALLISCKHSCRHTISLYHRGGLKKSEVAGSKIYFTISTVPGLEIIHPSSLSSS